MSMLITQVPLTFTRYGAQVENKWGQMVPSEPESISAVGALQPYRLGEQTSVLPVGKKTSDLRIYYTKTKLKAADEYNQTPPDVCEIGGVKFEVFDAGDWTTNGSSLKHYKVILVRKEASS